MRLITHNMLKCNVKNCTVDNYPLLIQGAQTETVEVEFNANFLRGFLNRIDWPSLKAAAQQLNCDILPEKVPEDLSNEDAFLANLHKVLLEVHVTEGCLTCKNCSRQYPIKNGITNMLLKEDEV